MSEEKNLWQEDHTSQDLKFYFEVSRKPLLVSLGLILFFYILSLVSFLEWSKGVLNVISYSIILMALVIVGYRVAKVKYGEMAHASTTGAFVGLILGIVHAILQTIWFWSWWMILDLILEPLTISLIGLLIGLIITKILQIINKPEIISPVLDEELEEEEEISEGSE